MKEHEEEAENPNHTTIVSIESNRLSSTSDTKSNGSGGLNKSRSNSCDSVKMNGKTPLRATKSVGAHPENDKNDDENCDTTPNKQKIRQSRSVDMGDSQGVKNRLPRAVVYPFMDNKEFKKSNNVIYAPDKFHVEEPLKFDEYEFFDPDDEMYMANACCECMHYRTATICVAFLEMFLLLLWASLVTFYYMSTGNAIDDAATWIITCQAILAFVLFLSIISLLAGVMFEKHVLLYPHMTFQLLGIGTGLLFTFLAVVVMAVGSDVSEKVFGHIFGQQNLPIIEQKFGPIWPFCLAVVFDFSAAVGIWFYVLVKGYYDFLQDKLFFERTVAARGQKTKKQLQTSEKND